MGDSVDCRVEGGVRFDSNSKKKTSSLLEPNKEEVVVSCSDKAMNLSENTYIISSIVSTELARVQAKVEFDLELQKIEYQGNTNIIDSAEFKLKEGSRTKLVKSLDLTFLVKLFCMLISLYFSTSEAEDLWKIIERRWVELRSKPSNPEQAWLIPQPSRNSWGDTRDFNKVSLVCQIIGYKPRINNKNDAKSMDKYLPN